MPQPKLIVLPKVEAVGEGAQTGNLRKTAAKWKFYPSIIRICYENYEKINADADRYTTFVIYSQPPLLELNPEGTMTS